MELDVEAVWTYGKLFSSPQQYGFFPKIGAQSSILDCDFPYQKPSSHPGGISGMFNWTSSHLAGHEASWATEKRHTWTRNDLYMGTYGNIMEIVDWKWVKATRLVTLLHGQFWGLLLIWFTHERIAGNGKKSTDQGVVSLEVKPVMAIQTLIMKAS